MRGERFTSRFGQSFWMPFKSLAQKNAVCASCGCSIYPHACVVVLCIISQIISPLLMAIPYKFILHNIWGGNVLPAAFTALTIFSFSSSHCRRFLPPQYRGRRKHAHRYIKKRRHFLYLRSALIFIFTLLDSDFRNTYYFHLDLGYCLIKSLEVTPNCCLKTFEKYSES